jgi:hypothetical protein
LKTIINIIGKNRKLPPTGGEVIHSFALALLIGVVVGTYSSIYVARSMILALGISKQDLLPSEKEEKEIQPIPLNQILFARVRIYPR